MAEVAEEALDPVEWTGGLDDDPSDEIIDQIELMGVLMERDWLGLRLLHGLREHSGAATASRLAGDARIEADAGASTLARLLQFGALTLDGDCFQISPLGWFVLRRIEEIVAEKGQAVVAESAG